MFGIFRFALALLVVIYHLSDHHVAGWYSVYAFYVLSGFLMTLVIAKKYRLTATGIGNFTLNRVLRIYPPYLAVVAATLLVLQIPSLAERARELYDIAIPRGSLAWFENLFIWGWHRQDPKLVPQVWTVFRELSYCVLLFFPFARFRWLTLAWLAGSLVYAATTVVRGLALLDVYTTFSAASLAYSMGACLYHFHGSLRRITHPLGPLICLAAIAPFAFEAIRPQWFAHTSVIPLYVNLGLSTWLVLLLSGLNGPLQWQRIDRYLGNLSYPVYLWHGIVPVVVVWMCQWPAVPSNRLLWVSLLPIMVCAWAMNRWVEQTVGYGYDKRHQPWFRATHPHEESGSSREKSPGLIPQKLPCARP
jgi:peptidoglycan/LPS O-acetylase OafA/YrhL